MVVIALLKTACLSICYGADRVEKFPIVIFQYSVPILAAVAERVSVIRVAVDFVSESVVVVVFRHKTRAVYIFISSSKIVFKSCGEFMSG